MDNLSSPECGLATGVDVDGEKSTTAFQVYNGRTSVKGEHPWYAQVDIFDENGKEESSCGGTLIRENIVLTGNYFNIEHNGF